MSTIIRKESGLVGEEEERYCIYVEGRRLDVAAYSSGSWKHMWQYVRLHQMFLIHVFFFTQCNISYRNIDIFIECDSIIFNELLNDINKQKSLSPTPQAIEAELNYIHCCS